jgi:hypothetical protein
MTFPPSDPPMPPPKPQPPPPPPHRNTVPPVPPKPGVTVNEFVADKRPMTEHKALGAAAGGAVGAVLGWWLCRLIWHVNQPEGYAILLLLVVGAICAGAGAYLAPRNRFKVHEARR